MSVSQLEAAEMIARCERNKRRSSPDPYACPDAYAPPEQRFQYLPGFEYSKGAEKFSPNNCAIIERTRDGVSVGPCTHYLENGTHCPRHGKVRERIPEQREVGRGGLHEEIESWLRSLGNRCFYIHHRTDKRVSMFQKDIDFVGWILVPGKGFGFPWAIEIKSVNKKPTLEQLARLKQAESAGAITGIAHSLTEFKAILGMP